MNSSGYYLPKKNNLLNLTVGILVKVRKFLNPRCDWELCKVNKRMFVAGPLLSHMDSILAGLVKKKHEDNRNLGKHYRWLSYCASPVKSLSLEVQKAATIAAIRRLATEENKFCANGSISLEPHETIVYVRMPDSKNAAAIDFSNPLTRESIEALLQAGRPASFGVGSEEILDPEYRKAIAITPAEFSVNFHRVLPIILYQISSIFGTSPNIEIQAQLYQLNIYESGGFFKTHVDTPRGNNMFGSLVVGLPIDHRGGEFVVRHEGAEQLHSFEPTEANKLRWTAFYSDCEHEVLPVKSGFRVTLTFNLYSVPNNPMDGLEIKANPIYGLLLDLLKNQSFMENGGEVAFGLKFEYPFEKGKTFETLPLDHLKGIDLQIYLATSELGLESTLQAVYAASKPDCWEREGGGDNSLELNLGTQLNNGTAIMLSDNFDAKGVYEKEERELYDILLESNSALENYDLFWITLPKKTFQANSYIAYGNEPDSELKTMIYLKVALIVEIPPFDSYERRSLS
ncbi:hypothetical protein HK098_001043 [Nowakowskiella sp. JEL0407]|nr:hypothetical protein HK098_001043 [Nowakowskiella sp. JEL0407]